MKKNRVLWFFCFSVIGLIVLLILYAITFSLIPVAEWMPLWVVNLIDVAISIKTSMITDYIFYSLIVTIIGALTVSAIFLKNMSNKKT